MNVRASMEDVKYTVSTRMAHTIVIVKKATALLLIIPHVGVSLDKDIIILSGSLWPFEYICRNSSICSYPTHIVSSIVADA